MSSKWMPLASNMISRRRLLGAATLMATGSLAPNVHAYGLMRPWAEEAAGLAAPLAAACVNHPFVKGLADGSLSEERFVYYIGQNIHYLMAYQKSLRALSRRMEDPNHRKRFEDWADETAATEQYTRDVYASFSPRIPDILIVAPTTQLYMGWEAQATAFLPVHEAVAAMLPCFWSYGEVGRFVAKTKKTQGNRYADWIAGYGDPAYEKTVAEAMGIGSDVARDLTPSERFAMTAAFLRSNRLEWMFWDAAWRLETWPAVR